jgi:hypothetical protein
VVKVPAPGVGVDVVSSDECKEESSGFAIRKPPKDWERLKSPSMMGTDGGWSVTDPGCNGERVVMRIGSRRGKLRSWRRYQRRERFEGGVAEATDPVAASRRKKGL